MSWSDLIAWSVQMARGTYGAIRFVDLVGMPIGRTLAVIDEYNRMMQELKRAAEE